MELEKIYRGGELLDDNFLDNIDIISDSKPHSPQK